jgi:DNA invertase Pin-like site-specific DNA recombinase
LAIYTRLSLAQDASVSIARQRETLEQWAEQLGGVYDPAVDYFEDEDVSAKGTVYRPAAETLLRAVLDDRYDGVLVWEFARFMRTVRDTHTACGLMREHAAELYSHQEQHLTLYGPGRIVLEFAADQAEKELLKISDRVSAARAYLSQFGPAPATAPFGTRKVDVLFPGEGRIAPLHRLVPDEEPRADLGGHSPAQMVRAAAAAVLSGQSIRSITMSWNEVGYRTSTGAEWGASQVSQLLRNPLLVGYSVHRGQVVTDDHGKPILFHEPVLDLATWTDLVVTFDSRVVRPRARNEALLRGLIRCGKCGAAMSSSGSGRSHPYRCWRSSHGGCSNTIVAARTEALVVTAALEVLGDPERLALLRADGDEHATAVREEHQERAGRLRDALDRLERNNALGAFDDPDGARRYAKVKAGLVSELDEVLASERRLHRPRPLTLPGAAGLTPAQAFDAATPSQQRTMLGELIEHIVIAPAPRPAPGNPRPAPKYRPERVSITWHQGSL